MELNERFEMTASSLNAQCHRKHVIMKEEINVLSY
jgi:hypothetical protein